MSRCIEAGQDVAAKLETLKQTLVRPSTTKPGCYDSKTLCAFQRKVSECGYVEAEIVESIYGFSVRYASGLQNFSLIFSARAKETDGTLEGAIAVAKRWQSADPAHRFVSRFVKE